jgi:hypothetical protein
MPKEEPKEGLKLVIALSIIVGASLIGVLGIGIIEITGKTILPLIFARTFAQILFWFSFALMVFCIYKFTTLSKYFNDNRKMQALASLGLVIAIAQLGQFAVVGINFFKKYDALLLPEIVRQILLYIIFWVGFAYIVYAIYVYKKV